VLPIRAKSNLNTFSRYTLNGYLLFDLTPTSDLGVFVDSNLAFKEHICTVISKAQQRVSVFFRGFASRSFDNVRNTYNRSIFEYNSKVWNPSHKYHIDLLENVQRRVLLHLKITITESVWSF
jgi:hypothetical protein